SRPPRPPLLRYTPLFRSCPSPPSSAISLSLKAPTSSSPSSPSSISSPLLSSSSPPSLSTSPSLPPSPLSSHGISPPSSSPFNFRSEEHTSELQSRENLVC